ncbi:MAG: GatB/YqeY domain-containing protein [Candidatus Kapabacteria bacterium]|nr:GatB/YqeY domain-containing protein [Candidatus Kapabacteria bacterium]
MNLTETINQQLKAAMLSGDKVRLETLRSIRALILEFEKSGIDRAMTAEDEIKILTSAAKKRKDAIEAYDNAGRNDAADKERSELAIIQEFLPAQMSDDDVRAELQTVIALIGASSPSDVGKVMGAAMKTLKGKADGNVIQRIAKELLGAS